MLEDKEVRQRKEAAGEAEPLLEAAAVAQVVEYMSGRLERVVLVVRIQMRGAVGMVKSRISGCSLYSENQYILV